MPRFLRDNAALVIGLALPIVVVAIFLLVSRAPGALTPPPAHDLLLRADGARRMELPYRVDIGVVGDRVRARIFRIEPQGPPERALLIAAPIPRLFLWEHEGRTLREIEIALPENVEALPDGTEIALPGLEGRRVVTTLAAPDGYAYGRSAAGPGSGLFGMLFGGGGERRVAIVKDGARVVIPLPDGLQYWNIEFVGWLVD